MRLWVRESVLGSSYARQVTPRHHLPRHVLRHTPADEEEGGRFTRREAEVPPSSKQHPGQAVDHRPGDSSLSHPF
jgi:hypothetical protein